MMSILIRFDLNHFNLNKMSFYIRITSYKGAISVEIVEGWLILYLNFYMRGNMGCFTFNTA